MSDLQAKVFNEKLKGLTLMQRNGAMLVTAAAIAKWYNEGLGVIVALWLGTAATMVFTGTELLSLMQSED